MQFNYTKFDLKEEKKKERGEKWQKKFDLIMELNKLLFASLKKSTMKEMNYYEFFFSGCLEVLIKRE